MTARPWLITGATGLLGAACVDAVRRAGHAVVALHHQQPALPAASGVTWQQADLVDVDATTALVAAVQPAVILHTAAMSQPRECELRQADATAINLTATQGLARAAQAQKARFILLSTDVLFSGHHAPYAEDDPPDPLSHYGRTKVAAEQAVLSTCGDRVVVRPSLLLGPSPHGNRGVEEVLASALQRGQDVELFTDEFRCPLSAHDLAILLVWLGGQDVQGVLHAAGPERLSRHEIGLQVARAFGLRVELLKTASVTTSTGSIPARAPDTTLTMTRLHGLGPQVPLPRTLAQVLAAHPRAARG